MGVIAGVKGHALAATAGGEVTQLLPPWPSVRFISDVL